MTNGERFIVGLTGGIGSGKSTVADYFRSRGALVIDADQIARQVVEPGSAGLHALVDAFGPSILTPTGSLDREALAKTAFESAEAKRTLDAVMHPLISERSAEEFRRAAPGQIIVHDVPLLVELGLQDAYDVVIVVDSDDELRLERLEARGLSRDEARRRMGHQASRDERLAVADLVIVNDGSRTDLEVEAQNAWEELKNRSAN